MDIEKEKIKAFSDLELLGSAHNEIVKVRDINLKIVFDKDHALEEEAFIKIWKRIQATNIHPFDKAKIFLTCYGFFANYEIEDFENLTSDYFVSLVANFRHVEKIKKDNPAYTELVFDTMKSVKQIFDEIINDDSNLGIKLREMIESQSLEKNIGLFERLIKDILRKFPVLLDYPLEQISQEDRGKIALEILNILNTVEINSFNNSKVAANVAYRKVTPPNRNYDKHTAQVIPDKTNTYKDEDDRITSLIEQGDSIFENSSPKNMNQSVAKTKKIKKLFDNKFKLDYEENEEDSINESLLKMLDLLADEKGISSELEEHLRKILKCPLILLEDSFPQRRAVNTINNINDISEESKYSKISLEDQLKMMITFYGMAQNDVLHRVPKNNIYDIILSYAFIDARPDGYEYLMHMFDDSKTIEYLTEQGNKDLIQAFNVIDIMIADGKKACEEVFRMNYSDSIDKSKLDNVDGIFKAIAEERCNTRSRH